MTQPLIGLIGHKQAGKDSLASFLVGEHGYTRVAFADALKDIAYDLNPWIVSEDGTLWRLASLVDMGGWDDAKAEPDVRIFLQNLGVTIRQRDPEFWVDQAWRKIRDTDGPVVVTDVRFLNEAETVKFDLQGITARVRRHDADEAAAFDPHVSEHELDTYEANFIIDNDGPLEQLRSAAAGLAAAARARYIAVTVN